MTRVFVVVLTWHLSAFNFRTLINFLSFLFLFEWNRKLRWPFSGSRQICFDYCVFLFFCSPMAWNHSQNNWYLHFSESCRRQLRSLLLYLGYVFPVLINSLVCWLAHRIFNCVWQRMREANQQQHYNASVVRTKTETQSPSPHFRWFFPSQPMTVWFVDAIQQPCPPKVGGWWTGVSLLPIWMQNYVVESVQHLASDTGLTILRPS